eukprot:TRINITY_DN10325_c0_g1_i1.p1 TRINITY_DN10325_c0_g1~~TRINITY_DN10325_c0_g1_i1.p1  ORF type:complete len:1357 (+),score=486.70 TRINITY_DN10325_c0_g1_i1:58-4071(+)
MEKTANAPEASHLAVDSGSGLHAEGTDGAAAGDNTEVDIYDTNLTQDEIQKIISGINTQASNERKRAAVKAALTEVEQAAKDGDADKCLAGLKNPVLGIQAVEDDSKDQYVTAVNATVAKGPLTKDSLQEAVDEGNASAANDAKVSQAMGSAQECATNGDAEGLMQVLTNAKELLQLPELNADGGELYMAKIKQAMDEGKTLTPELLRQLIEEANAELAHQAKVDEAVQQVNRALDNADFPALLAALQADILQLNDVDPEGAEEYHVFLNTTRKSKGSDLSRDEIQAAVDAANFEAEENAKHRAAMCKLNEAVMSKKPDAAQTLACLKNPYTKATGVLDSCAERYQRELRAAGEARVADKGVCVWRASTTEDGRPYYYNKETRETSWTPPDELLEYHLSLEEVQTLIDRSNKDDARWQQFVNVEDDIVKLQSQIRGMLVRKRHQDRMAYLAEQEGHIVKMQAAFRGKKQREAYKERMDYLKANEEAVIKIQSAFRGRRERDQYSNLTQGENPPVTTVRRFLHLLDQSEADFAEELKVQQLKQKVVLAIQHNADLDHNLNEMDIKIGLLVKNRISLQDVEKQNRQLKKARKRGSLKDLDAVLAGQQATGLKSLTKDARERLESYQHLFYLLQTQPEYLAKLVYIDRPREGFTATRASNFLQRLIQLVFNYASNAREQYLLLKLYRNALKTEVTNRVDEIRQINTGNPLFIKLVVNQYRDETGSTYVRQVLSQFMSDFLKRGTLDLDADPVNVYKRWLNQTEAQTGQTSTLSRNVTAEEALKHEPVQEGVDKAVETLLELSAQLRDCILSNLKDLPYGLRYICKALKGDLKEKFPEDSDDVIIIAVGVVLYYRYFNPIIVTPERFLDNDKGQPLVVEDLQRRNLASVGRILQACASGQAGEGSHPKIQAFINSSWPKFKEYFEQACDVPEPEAHFNMDEYTDVVMLTKPQITLSPEDIYYTHDMLVTNVDVVCNPKDQLREVLDDLGPVGTEEEALGEPETPQRAASKSPMLLTLNNKFEVPLDDNSNVKALYVRTKRLVVDVIRFQAGKNLMQILSTPASEAVEEAHKEFFEKQKADDERLSAKAAKVDQGKSMKRYTSSSNQRSEFMTLKETKAKIISNAAALEQEGLCSKEDGYQALLNAVAQDIRNQRIHRKRRRAEVGKLTHALEELSAKKSYYEEQVESWDMYIKTTVQHMGQGTNAKRSRLGLRRNGGTAAQRKRSDSITSTTSTSGKGEQYFGSFNYTAAKLKDKGILVSMDSVGVNPKLIKMTISSEETGIFFVNASVMGQSPYEPERIELVDLLQKQYEGIPTMKFFDNAATVNINLLVFLINKKFYNR